MRSRLVQHAVAICAAAMLAATPALAQSARVTVGGDMWLKSSSEVRKAFLVGAGNMLSLETGYSQQKKGMPLPPPTA